MYPARSPVEPLTTAPSISELTSWVPRSSDTHENVAVDGDCWLSLLVT